MSLTTTASQPSPPAPITTPSSDRACHEIDADTDTSIVILVTRQVRAGHVSDSDRDDLTQFLRKELLCRAHRYRPEQGAWPTFVRRVLEGEFKRWLRHHLRERRDRRLAQSIHGDDGSLLSPWAAALPDQQPIVLIDEAHLIPPDGEGMYQTFLRDARVVNPHLRLVGLTATPFRLKDGPICAPGNLLNHVCYEVGVKELIRDGFLSPLVSKAGKAKADTTGLHVRGGEFIPDEVEHLMDDDGLVRAACVEIAEQTRSRKACLVFAAGVHHAEHVAATLASAVGAEVACIFGHTPEGERDRLVARFKQGALRYLVNVGVLTTGFDAPQVDCVSLLRPTNGT